MDVFDQVAETRPEIADAEGNLTSARAALMIEISGARNPVRSRAGRRPWLLALGAGCALAAVTAGALIVGGVSTPAPSIVADPTPPLQTTPPSTLTPTPMVTVGLETPQAALGAASASAIHGGMSPQAGQYLRVMWTTDVLLLSDGTTIAQPGQGLSYSMATRAWVVRTSGSFFVPADVGGDWYFSPSAAPVVMAAYGQDAATDPQMQQYLDRWSTAAGLDGFRAGGGALPEGDGTLRGEILTSLPDDADGVLAWLRARQSGTSELHQRAMVGWTLMTLLASNAGTGEVRAAMLQALADLPGSSIVDSRGSIRTVAFESTFGEEPGEPQRHQTITVDVSTGRVIGTSDSTNPGGTIVPDGVVDERNDYAVEIVDGLPD